MALALWMSQGHCFCFGSGEVCYTCPTCSPLHVEPAITSYAMLSIPEKKLRWQEKRAEFARLTDKVGMPIDAGILETVIALNILDIATNQSCEGHLDHG